MKTIIKSIFVVLLALAAACNYDFPETPVVEPSAGQADFTKMVTLGSSITAGVMDGALYNRSQQNSFAVILARQMQEVGGGPFNVPEINAEVGFFGPGPGGISLGRLILRANPTTGTILPDPIVPGNPITPFTGNKAALNNFGVNRISLGTALIPETGNINQPNHPAFNAEYARFASNPGSSTLVGDAAAALANGGTFFTFWLGKNDVLGYALTGASNPSILTSDADFASRYSLALGAMLQANPEAKGAVANIPNINVLPYFTLIPWNALPLTSAQLPLANAAYQAYNQGLDQALAGNFITAEERNLRRISFQVGANGFVMSDETLTDLSAFGLPSIRKSNANDRATLPLAQVLGTTVGGNPLNIVGLTIPVGDEYVLIPSEIAEISQKINTFNTIIANAVQAQSTRLVLVDIHNLLNRVLQGQINAGGVALTASIVPPAGGFSVDGVHPNARASAFIANHFIEVINEKWGSTIPKVNPNEFMGNDLPR
ncbi:hypothetical protein ADIS_0025 [Lunatimonas lonarensis]|uniref:Lipolytic enzyme, G-D-S-L n=1 Tax=Lunatimonas lonarensis TaxID=1232681 RepID=R7ZZI2_9BACT|nr:hypothetical protein [Lunatimonas lonarensis]EON79458.1 hypothetical protein ADIS_0025 [Lunatimonas lonarensis]